ncbi:hypothetical protein MXB_613 [Myxobolus squamalis]|nr:hypothetical protein MXB_613 [Myxobolus squamalis]
MEERVQNDILNANAKMSLRPQPYGNVLIIAPWNFPLILSLEPFMGALAAVLKTSELIPNTSALIRKLIESYLDTVVQESDGLYTKLSAKT